MIPRSGVVFLLAGALACGGDAPPPADTPAAAPAPAAPDDAPAALAARDARPGILFVGTSLTAALGLDPAYGYPAVIQRRLDSLGLAWQAINAGVSGETSAGALRRIESLLDPGIRVVVVETGANDGLRGIEPESTRSNIAQLIGRVRAFDPAIRIVLAGMQAPPNMGPRFTERFQAIFPALAAQERVALIPFLLDGVGGDPDLNQDDGIHPTARGQERVAENVWHVVREVLR